jgi:hypothetical protein
MNEFLDNAKQVPHDRILTFEELRAQVLHEIMHPEKYVGIPVPSLPVFTSLIKGFRRGEITVMTGPTGSGKVRNETAMIALGVCAFLTHSCLLNPCIPDTDYVSWTIVTRLCGTRSEYSLGQL